MRYHAYELVHAFLSPLRLGAEAVRLGVEWPLNPFAYTPLGRSLSAACQVFESATRRYGKPQFALSEKRPDGSVVPVIEECVLSRPFCRLVHFRLDDGSPQKDTRPKVLIVAPLSGHYATLLRGTVAAMLAEHDVYITDWVDARDVPLIEGAFNLESSIDYLAQFMRAIGPGLHVMAVCQPAVGALAATALLAAADDPCQPRSLVLMGGPIDTRINPTSVNAFASYHPLSWFEKNVISYVPAPHLGAMRRVYPGFMQLTGFMAMNLDRHVNAHLDLFNSLVQGDCDSARQHQRFYEEYMAVLDLTAEFYLDTIDAVFHRQTLARGELTHRGTRVDCRAIRKTLLMTIEGERDDICGLGQTEAAHGLCSSLPDHMRQHLVQPGVGHYGLFNGTRWRQEIQPRIRDVIHRVETGAMADEAGSAPRRRLRLVKSATASGDSASESSGAPRESAADGISRRPS